MGEISNCGSKTYRTAAVSGLTCGALRGQSTSTARRVTWRCAAQSAVQSRCHWLPLVDDIPCMYIQMYMYIYIYTCVNININLNINISLKLDIHIYIYRHCTKTCAYMDVYAYLYTCIYTERERDIKIQLSYENGYSPL